MNNKTTAATEFVERFGIAGESQLLPRIAGRLMAYLMVQDTPVTADFLADELMVSRASISTNTRLLESLGILERVGKPGDRRDWYQATDDPFGHLLDGELTRLVNIQRVAADGLAALPKEAKVGRARLTQMVRFYGHAIDAVETIIVTWQNEGQ